jgi:glyoxylase-like metal-dependent hydrolase (beta-lactamase superfamily II)
MKLERISKHVYVNVHSNTGGNVGVIVFSDSAAAVDSQYPVSGADFRRSIISITPKPVTHLLLTHYHPDHVFGNQAFEDCKIVAHRLTKKRMEENLRTIWAPGNLEKEIEEINKYRSEIASLFEGLRIVLPTITFGKFFRLNDVVMIHMGGHTLDSTVIHVKRDRVLFAGDLVFPPDKELQWAGDPSADPDAWIKALEKILTMDVEKIVPGHGPVCDKSVVEAQLAWFKTIREKIAEQVNRAKSWKLFKDALREN